MEHSPLAVAIGQFLRTARGARSCKEIAERTNGLVQARMIRNYEQGIEPKISTFLILCAALGYKPGQLLPAGLMAAAEGKDVPAIARIIASV